MLAPTLTTDRLILRATQLDDFGSYAAIWADPRVTDYIGGTPRSRAESWLRFGLGAGLWSLHGFGYWMIVERETGTLAGVGGLGNFERGLAELLGFPEAGWALGADHWGKGYATEAVGAIVAWADAALAHEIRCIIDPGNMASVRVAEKHGFAKCGELRTEVWNTDVFRRLCAT